MTIIIRSELEYPERWAALPENYARLGECLVKWFNSLPAGTHVKLARPRLGFVVVRASWRDPISTVSGDSHDADASGASDASDSATRELVEDAMRPNRD